MTVFVAGLFVLLFPKSSQNPTSIVGINFFTERQAQMITARVIRDDATKAQLRKHVSRKEIKDGVSDLLP